MKKLLLILSFACLAFIGKAQVVTIDATGGAAFRTALNSNFAIIVDSLEAQQIRIASNLAASTLNYNGILSLIDSVAKYRLIIAGITADTADWNDAFEWGDHASGGYAPLANPNFTGVVRLATNDTLATQAYARSYGGTGGGLTAEQVGEQIADSLISIRVALNDTVQGNFISPLQAVLNGDELNISIDMEALASELEIEAGGISDSSSLYFYHEIQPFYTMTAGHMRDIDSTIFMDGYILDSWFNRSADTLVVTSVVTGIYGGANDTMRHEVMYAKQLFGMEGRTKLMGDGNIEVGADEYGYGTVETTSFTNDTIPPDVWVWALVKGPLEDVRPKYWASTISGYKIKGTFNDNPFDLDVTAPTLASLEVGTYNDTIIVAIFDEGLLGTVPDPSAFEVMAGNVEWGVNIVHTNDDTLFVAMDSTLAESFADSTITLSYTPESPYLSDSAGNQVAAFDSVVTNNLPIPPVATLWIVVPRGDSTGTAPITMIVNENITLTATGTGRFYSDGAGTSDESATWSVTTGATRNIYFKSQADTSWLSVSDISKITEFGWGWYNWGWKNPTNAPKLVFNADDFSTTALTRLTPTGYYDAFGDLSDYTALLQIGINGEPTNINQLTVNINNLTSLTNLSGTITASGSLANLTSLTTLYLTGNERNTLTYSTYTWPSSMSRFDVSIKTANRWSVSDISAAIIDASETTWTGSKVFALGSGQNHNSMANTTQGGIWGDFSGEASPSALAVAYKTLRRTLTVTVTLNGITAPDVTGDGTGFPAGFGDWYRAD